jgi:LacI family transcriptional regulator
VVRSELAERVRQAARDLRYVSNAPAQALARATTSVVGLIVHEVDDPYFSAIAAGAMRVATEHGLLTMLANVFHDPSLEIDYVRRLQAQRARAVVLTGSGYAEDGYTRALGEALEEFARGGGRVACVTDHGVSYDTVLPDNRGGGAQVAKLLHDLGHRRVGVISGPPLLMTVRLRLEGFRRAWRAFGSTLPAQLVVDGDFTRAGGYAALPGLMEATPRPTAVFALNDMMAIGALAAARDELSLRVPEDLSIVGFDDVALTADVTPTLTTVRLPLEEIGAHAVRLVLRPPSEPTRIIRVAADLVARNSTAPPSRRGR